MKKTHLFLTFAAALTTTAASANLLITGLVDGPLSGGLPKAIEIYVVNDVADLSIYGIGSANNGGGTDGEELTFSGSATAGDFLYVASENAEFTDTFGFAPDFFNSAANINGDDAIELFMNGVVIDLFGDINVDGTGQAWEHLDSWAYRNNTAITATTSFDIADWTFGGPNALDGLSASETNAAVPFGTYTPVPEPSTYALIFGALGLAFVAYRRRK